MVNGIVLRWEGARLDEKGYDAGTDRMLVCANPAWFRPTGVDNFLGDPVKAKVGPGLGSAENQLRGIGQDHG